MERLESVGMDRERVERAVRANAYTHEAACYEMLFSSLEADKAARLSSRDNGTDGSPFNPFALMQFVFSIKTSLGSKVIQFDSTIKRFNQV